MHTQYIDDVPGSLQLVEEEWASGEDRAQAHDIVLSPTPSNDVNDPLNWSRYRKLLSLACVYVYVGVNGFATCLVYSLYAPIQNDTGISLATLNQGSGYSFLFLGLGGLITLPVASVFGNRPVYLLSTLVVMACSIWTSYIQTDGSWIAMKIITGLFFSPVESLAEVSISQIFFAHERGFYMGLYGFILFGSNYFAPALAGFIYEGVGWQWTMFIAAFLSVGAFAFLLVFQEETNCIRILEPTSSASPLADNEKMAEVNVTVFNSGLTGTPTTYIRKLSLYRGRFGSNRLLVRMMYRPLLLIPLFPVVLWSGFAYGSALIWYNVLNGTTSSIMSGTPYNFATSQVGLMFFAPTLGVFFGGPLTGWLGDKYALRAARRNGGVREPEQRLILMIASCILVPVGLICWGVGGAHGQHWFLLAFGIFCLGAQSGTTATIALTYLVDSYRELQTEGLIAVIIVRNILSFAIGYGITPWLEIGLQDCFLSAAGVGLAASLTFIPMMLYGKASRKGRKEQYWKFVATGDLAH